MQVRDIIKMLCALNEIRVFQLDSYINTIEEEEIYCGSILAMPWYILEYYLVDGEDIKNGKEILSIGFYKNNHGIEVPCFEIYVMEDKKNIK